MEELVGIIRDQRGGDTKKRIKRNKTRERRGIETETETEKEKEKETEKETDTDTEDYITIYYQGLLDTIQELGSQEKEIYQRI